MFRAKSHLRKNTGRLGLGIAFLAALALIAGGGVSADEKAHEFVGADKCKMCHKKPATGAQFVKWQEAKHSKAFETLGTDEAKAVAKKLGIEDPQKSGKCLQCHSTAYNHTETLAKNIGTNKAGEPLLTAEEGVSCESCHGAGSDYKKKKIMKDHDLSVANGMTAEPKKECVQCHNDKNPTWDNTKYKLADGTTSGFDFDQAWEKIKHPIPDAE